MPDERAAAALKHQAKTDGYKSVESWLQSFSARKLPVVLAALVDGEQDIALLARKGRLDLAQLQRGFEAESTASEPLAVAPAMMSFVVGGGCGTSRMRSPLRLKRPPHRNAE